MQHHWRTASPFAAMAGLICLLVPQVGLANPWDISLRGLGRPDRDPTAQARFKSLTTELAFALSPRAMQPAETLGMSGFEVAFVNSLTDINQSADYWQGTADSPVFEAPLHGRSVPKVLWTPTLHLRKGLPLSTEVGVQGTYLAYSELFLLGGEFKFALHESYFRWVPALSGRVAVGRLMGSNEIDMLTGEADIMTSLPIGIGGMLQLTPYLGYGQLFAHVNSHVLDDTPYSVNDPNTDQRGGVEGSLYSFETLDWQDNRYARIFGGLRVNVTMIEVLLECNVGYTGGSLGPSGNAITSYSLKIGFDV